MDNKIKVIIIIASIISAYLLFRFITMPVLPADCTADVPSFEDSNGLVHTTCLGKFINDFKAWQGTMFTVVNGYTCADQPSDSGCGGFLQPYVTCPSGVGGCAIDLYTNANPWVFINERKVNPGASVSVYSSSLGISNCYEVYLCNSLSCSCSDWTYYACNSNGCDNGYVYKERSCSPDNCQVESGCEYRAECYVPPAPSCVDECGGRPAGSVWCSGNNILACGNWDSDPCLETMTTACSSGMVCTASGNGASCATVPTCVDECGAIASLTSSCDGNNVVACGNYDSDSCREIRSTACSTGTTCTVSGSTASCVNNPTCTPGWVCKNAGVKAYQNVDCSQTQVTICPDGCSSGSCNQQAYSGSVDVQ